ncbi:hypothetical protein B296_00055620 [Ensete ventricosum]|uniref:Uncharacterized protein n=1 Tax=Ensete ventricosum TaxID=4639 RepID=A0A426WZE4_ENSVE|nr:hypothetical protein B296_00055620 [Ensete ventricosum]
MWRSSSCSRSLVRSLLGGSQRRKGASIALAFLSSSSSLYLAAGGLGGGSAAGSITFVDETKQKLERDGQEVTGYPQLLERTGFGRFRDDAVACRILHGAGAVLFIAYCLLRSLVEHSCINPKSLAFGYLDEKPVDTGLMKFLGLCPSALSCYLEFASAFSTSSAPFMINAFPP